MEDGRCKLGLLGRLELVRLVEHGSTLRAAAAALNVAPATAHRWWHRWMAATEGGAAWSLACLRSRSSRPHSCPWGLSAEAEQAILTARAKTNWGPMRLAWLTGRHRSTSGRSAGATACRVSVAPCARRAPGAMSGPRPARCCTSTPSSYPSSTASGHWAHGDRCRAPPHPPRGQGQGHRRHR